MHAKLMVRAAYNQCMDMLRYKTIHPLQGGYNGYNDYRPGYGAQNYAGSGMGGGGAYRGGRGAGDGGQMNNQNNPLWAAQGYPVTGPGGSVLLLHAGGRLRYDISLWLDFLFCILC